MLLEESRPQGVDRVPPDVVEVRRQYACEEVRRLGRGDELEEAGKGVLRGAFATSDVRLLREAVDGQRALEKRVGEDCGREKLAGPDDVGIAQVGEDVVGAELGFVD